MICHGIILSGLTGKSEVRNCWTAKSQTATPDRIVIKRTEKPVTGFSCVMGRFPCRNPWKASVAPFTPIPCQSRERSELNFTETTAIQVPDGRRRKVCSAICPILRGCYLSVLGVQRSVLKRSKLRLRHPFIILDHSLRLSVIHRTGIYSFLSFLFFLYSRDFN